MKYKIKLEVTVQIESMVDKIDKDVILKRAKELVLSCSEVGLTSINPIKATEIKN